MRIEILNPSSRSDTGITEDLARSLEWLAGPRLPELRCLTLADGPRGIVTARDSDEAAPAILRHIEKTEKDPDVAGFIVACFSDPGVYAARGITRKPVVGIGEAGFAAAIAVGDRFGTISVSAGPGGKLLRQLRLSGLAPRHAGHRGLGLNYGDLQYPDRVLDRLVAAGGRAEEFGGRAQQDGQRVLGVGPGVVVRVCDQGFSSVGRGAVHAPRGDLPSRSPPCARSARTPP